MARPQHSILSVILISFFSVASYAQDNFKGYFEPAIDLSYQVTPQYSQSFGIENRNYMYQQNELVYNVKQIDISHFSEYQWHPKYAVGIGLQYRWENAFNTEKENELRLQQQFVYTPENSAHSVSHRFRTEQRLYASVTKHRFRYQLGYKFPLNQENRLQPYLKTATESLLELAKTQKPEFEQRLSLGIGGLLNEKTTLQIGVEYQLADYVQDLNHELFLFAELGITL